MIPRPSRRQGRLIVVLSHRFNRRSHRWIAPVLAVVWPMLIAAGAARARGPEAIDWRQDYSSAFEEAKSSERLLWIQFTGPWCPNCRRMERDSFPDPEVVHHASESYVPVKLRSDANEQLALAFNLSGLPATVIVAPDREVLSVQQGYLGPDALDDLLSRAHDGWAARSTADADNDEMAHSNNDNAPNAAGTKTADADAAAKAAGPTSAAKAAPAKLALEGHCPVSLVADRRLVRGRAEHSLEHDGRIYRFASAALLKRFQEAPERFVPANQGDCPVAKLDGGAELAGSPRWGVLFQDRLFLCASDENRQQFLQFPARYATVDVAEQGFCPHCIAENGLLVRGDPKYTATREGRRFWFPDANHRAAFLARAKANVNANANASASARAVDASVRR